MIYGVDVSAYQPNFDFGACAREGFDFAIIKATEGVGWRSAYFGDDPKTGAAGQLRRARDAGLLVAAYHYVNGYDVPGQLANIKSMVDVGTPVILDVEQGAGSIQSIRALNAALNAAGYRTPLIYIPRWYWSGTMGSPDLTGLPPNWHSAYPDNVVRRKDAFVDSRPSGPDLRPTFPSFGGINTEVSQFTSSLAVANYPYGRIDGNAYRGTREQLAALFGGTQEDDMTPDELLNTQISIRDESGNVTKTESLRTLFEWLGNEFNATRKVAAEPIDYDKLATKIAEKAGTVTGVTAAEAKSIAVAAINDSRVRYPDSTTGGAV